MLVNLNSVLIKAREEKYCIPAFDCTEDILIRAILDTCEKRKSPVILMAVEEDLKENGIDYIASTIKGVANRYSIPIVLHLDHGNNIDIIKEAISYGFTSVMYDGSMLSFEENIIKTREVVEYAHSRNVTVEAELGRVGQNEVEDNEKDESELTAPAQVIEFVKRTNVDALAVSIGTAHGVYVAEPILNIPVLTEINKLSSVPLVLHGGSGTPDHQIKEAITNGISKLNIYADLRIAMFKGLKIASNYEGRIDPTPDIMFSPIKQKLEEVITHKINICGSNNKK